jgi:hypothetical protein
MVEEKSGKKKPTVSWYKRWGRIGAILGGIASVFVIVGYFVSWDLFCQWLTLCSRDKYTLTGVQAELSLGESETLGVARRHNDDTSEPVTDMICRWRYQPLLPGLTTGDRCSVKITNGASYFSGSAPQDIPLTAIVDLWRQDSSGSSAVATLSATTTLRYAALPKIHTSADTVVVSQSLPVSVTFPFEGRPTKFDCHWAPTDRFTDADACMTNYNPDPAIQADTSTKLEVDVRGPDGISLGTATKEITVVVPPVHFMLFVIDDTAKAAQPVGNGSSFLAAMQRDVLSSVSQPNAGVDQFLGLYIFGGPLPPTVAPGSSNSDCARFGSVYRLARFDADKADQALQGLHPEGSRAPLVSATVAALAGYRTYQKQIQAQPNDRFSLTIITASNDDCDPSGAQGFLEVLGKNLNNKELTGINYDNKLLPIMLRLADPSDAATRAILQRISGRQSALGDPAGTQ